MAMTVKVSATTASHAVGPADSLRAAGRADYYRPIRLADTQRLPEPSSSDIISAPKKPYKPLILSGLFKGMTFYIERNEVDENRVENFRLIRLIKVSAVHPNPQPLTANSNQSHGGRTYHDPSLPDVTHVVLHLPTHTPPDYVMHLHEMQAPPTKPTQWTQAWLVRKFAPLVNVPNLVRRQESWKMVVRTQWIEEAVNKEALSGLECWRVR